MRLIDADKIPFRKVVTPDYEKPTEMVSKKIIDAMPTVDIDNLSSATMSMCETAFNKGQEVMRSKFNDCKNELCLKCGLRSTQHLGSCDGCRWNKE